MINITKEQYWQLVGLKTLAMDMDKQLREIQKSVAGIIGEKFDPGSGWAGELVFTSRTLDNILDCAKVTVFDIEEKDEE